MPAFMQAYAHLSLGLPRSMFLLPTPPAIPCCSAVPSAAPACADSSEQAISQLMAWASKQGSDRVCSMPQSLQMQSALWKRLAMNLPISEAANDHWKPPAPMPPAATSSFSMGSMTCTASPEGPLRTSLISATISSGSRSSEAFKIARFAICHHGTAAACGCRAIGWVGRSWQHISVWPLRCTQPYSPEEGPVPP